MTEPDFDDPSYDELRALLADAAPPVTVPADVAALLDSTLAGLVADRSEVPAAVVPLRRRLAPRLLAAAAAVLVLGGAGIGIAQLGSGEDSMSTAQADREVAVPGASGPTGGGGAEPPPVPASGDSASGYGAADRLRFTEPGFSSQVENFLELSVGRSADRDGVDPADPAAPSGPGSGSTTPEFLADEHGANESGGTNATKDRDLTSLKELAAGSRCAGPPTTVGAVVVTVDFEGRAAALVVHPVVDGSRYVAAWSCNGRRLLAYTTVAVR